MSLTPKNWDTFQHYKDRAPAWIKLHRGLLDDYAFSRLPLASRALAPLLWLLASEYDGGKITASPAEIAFRLRTTEKELVAALKPLTDQGFFVFASVVLADCKQDAIPERERELEKQVEKEEDIRAVADATRPDETFDEFLKVYPKRDGANPKTPARKKFLAAVKSGVDPQAIIGAARRFAAEARERGQIGTPYVPQAMTWLSQQRWGDYAPIASSTGPPQPPNANLPSDAELRARYERKSPKPERDSAREAEGVFREGDSPDREQRTVFRH